MKCFLTLAALAASAFAQNIAIGAPADLATVTKGQNFTVQVNRPNTLTGSEEVAVVIGLWPCGGVNGDATCASQNVTEVLGTVVYNGPFNPQYHDQAPAGTPPHQNFSVAVPDTFQSGQVSLGVAHFSLVGASFSPFYEFKNVTLIVQ